MDQAAFQRQCSPLRKNKGLLIGLHLHPFAVGKTRSCSNVSLQRTFSRTGRDALTILPLNSLTSWLYLVPKDERGVIGRVNESRFN